MADLSELIRTIQHSLQYLHTETQQVYRSFGFNPLPDSLAAQELKRTPKAASILDTAFSQGAMLIEITGDQVVAFLKSLSNPVNAISPWVCARAALESSALGRWIMDTDIQPHERIKRSFAYRLEGLIQQRKYLSAEHQLQKAEAVQKRITKVEEDAIALDVVTAGSRRARSGVLVQMPSITEIVRSAADRESFYRLLSAVAHAHFWALNSLSFAPMHAQGGPIKTNTPAGTPTTVIEQRLQEVPLTYLTTEVMELFARLLWTRFRLFGWNVDDLVRVFETSYDLMSFRKDGSARFWRPNSADPAS